MANIGANETYRGYLVKASEITLVDSFIKTTTPTTSLATCEAVQAFRYRYLDANESLAQPLPSWLKERMTNVIFTSETNIIPKVKDAVYTEDGRKQIIVTVLPQKQLGAFAISKKYPHILNLE